ncbi:MAG: hypothetical protein E7510_12005, partial [Ruminococcus sp.]|nr:hypothetical protein [Ruminococcus sp.]
MEKKRHTLLTDKLAIHFFELGKINKKPDTSNKMQLWMQLINAETEGDLEMLEQTNVKEIQEAVLILREMSADEKMKELARRRELALYDRITDLEVSRAEGRAEGIEETKKIFKLFMQGYNAERISQELRIPKEQVQSIIN